MATTLCPNASKAVVTARLMGMTLYAGYGTGAGTTAASDTTLFTEDSGGSPAYTRQVVNSSQVTTTLTNDTHQMTASITANASKTITNAGVFDASTAGNLYVKGDFTGIAINNGEILSFTFKVKYA